MSHTVLGRRPRVRLLLLAGSAIALPLLTVVNPAQAHEKWFVDHAESFPTDWSFALRPLVLLALAAVVAVTFAWRGVAVRLGRPELPFLAFLGRLTPYLPRLLAIHLGVSLLAAATGGHFLTHDLDLDGLTAGPLLLLTEGALGVWFISGIHLRWAAVLLTVIGPAALLVTGPVDLMSAADLLGIAVFLVILPPSDDAPFGAVRPTIRQLRAALLAARLGAGVALITLAFAEKLANPALARETLHDFPKLDVFALVGISVPHDAFVIIAGCTEVLFGLLVISGAMPQLAVLVAGIPFNATLILFGATEMLGHLPVYGLFLTLLAYGSNPSTNAAVRWLPSLPQLRRARDLAVERDGAAVAAAHGRL